jgi:hypothetical protein
MTRSFGVLFGFSDSLFAFDTLACWFILLHCYSLLLIRSYFLQFLACGSFLDFVIPAF